MGLILLFLFGGQKVTLKISPGEFYLVDTTIATVNTPIVMSNRLWPQRAMSPSMSNLREILMIQIGA